VSLLKALIILGSFFSLFHTRIANGPILSILLETKGIGLKFFARIEASKYYTLMVTQILHVIVPPNGISGEFGRAMVRVFSRRSRFQILMARANEPDVTKAY